MRRTDARSRFHVKRGLAANQLAYLHRAATWAGWRLTSRQAGTLAAYADWLKREAIPQGALGPHEADRLIPRHLGDSLLFASAWEGPTSPHRLADIGSGAGLPGIPLSILWPGTRVTLIERRGRRADLLRRGLRVLELANTEVRAQAAEKVDLEVEMVVARAAGPLPRVHEWARRLLVEGGVLVVGGSWVEEPIPTAGEEIRRVPAEVLDRPVWLRIMAAP
ncbi:MAG: 16S rRNA (guanine(527)-N(7))-methyltransferase RsmG [Actinomycetota bacterium]